MTETKINNSKKEMNVSGLKIFSNKLLTKGTINVKLKIFIKITKITKTIIVKMPIILYP